MMKQRDTYVDIAKGIGILLIVSIHTEVFGVIGNPLAFVAVPIFFFMSGFYDRSDRNFNDYFKKSLKTLVLPAVVWILIATMYGKFLGFLKDGSWGENPFDWYNMTGGDGPAWFLFALFYTKVLTWGVIRMKLSKFLIWGGSLLIGYCGININMPLLLDEGCAALPLYVTGKYIYPYVHKIITNKWLLIAGILSFMTYRFHGFSFSIVPISNGNYSPYYLMALVLIFLVFLPFLFVSNKCHRMSIFAHLGQHSLGIMLVHAPMCHTAAVVLNRIFVVGSLSWGVCSLMSYIIIVALAYWVTVMVERYCPVMFGK